MEKGTISENELMKKLAGAKKVMNATAKKKFNPNMDYEDEPIINIPAEFLQENQLPQEMFQQTNPNISKPVGGYPVNEEKIRNSKLPEAIKEAMINNPIHQPTLSDNSLDIKIFENARRLMNEDYLKTTKKPTQQVSKATQPIKEQSMNTDELISKITPIIENTIRKILDEKLTQILTAHDTATINENLAIKVGNSIFQGKITKVKNSK